MRLLPVVALVETIHPDRCYYDRMRPPPTRSSLLVSSLGLVVLALVAGSTAESTSRASGAAPNQYIRIDGATGGDPVIGSGGLAGLSVAGAGDVNGDGRPDVVIGAPRESNNGRRDSGSAYVVFGQSRPATIDLSNLGSEGFRIDGATTGELAGRAVSGAGDVNGDRRPDVLVGAPGAFSGGAEGPRKARGKAYVVFGKSSSAPVDLARLGTSGFQITGRHFQFPDAFGLAVSGAGDINRDGHADVIVAAPGNPGFEEEFTPGSVYVIYGQRSSKQIRVDRLGRRGFKIVGAGGDVSVAGAGDVNGDRRSDVIIGNGSARVRGQTRGAAYVVFGARYRKTINLARLGSRGFQIQGANRLDSAGMSVAGAGHVNGDRLSDVVVGAPASPDIRPGAAYVVFGERSSRPVSLVTKGRPGLPRLGSRGFKIAGEMQGFAGSQVAGVRDVNADRRPDLALIAAGSVYVVFGKSSTSEVRLSALAGLGFKIDGTVYEPTGSAAFNSPGGFGAVAGAGDMNGDGRGDILVGAPDAGHNGRFRSGSAYIFFSR